ncbi:tripartite tricarboxylate transporter substrate binding protein [Cupriavidus necator]|uniref:Tripartite tricarboxylate transporter substrate binding protein n=1 Tax=Cupriavidus necator TaxID=106590 RepID=A0A1U9UY13_CUPNE|nr:tripartite tricarboxylate transporter substrate binding protein [Cupriavidus necator]AQV97297.1 tripartite tricarboxylate transporter substrate binding protein [Cupriavidus necator]
MNHRALLQMATCFAMALSSLITQAADTNPSPLVIKVGYAAGGAADTAVRRAGVPLKRITGRTIVPENLGGASGLLAAQSTLSATADGNTVACLTGDDLMGLSTLKKNGNVGVDQFKLVYPLRISDMALVSTMKEAPKGVDELIALSKKRTGNPLSFGNWGPGSLAHIAALDLRAQTKTDGIDVPYKGGALVLQDILAGNIDLAFLPLNGQIIDLVKAGKLHVVFVASDQRSVHLPTSPAAGESKLVKDFRYKIWPAIFVSRKTPPEVQKKLHAAFAAAVNDRDYQVWATSTGATPMSPMSMEDTEKFFQAEQARVIRAQQLIKASSY